MGKKAHISILDGDIRVENSTKKTFPTEPVNGDIWRTEETLFAYVNGKRYQIESGKIKKFYKYIITERDAIRYDSYEDDLNIYPTLKKCMKEAKVWLREKDFKATYYEITEKELE